MPSPYFVFIVGCPAAGKSTMARMICRMFTEYEFSSDLPALKEVFLIDDVTRDCIQAQKSPQEIRSVFFNLSSATHFWRDLLEQRLQELLAGSLDVTKLETAQGEDGGHSVMDPRLWDETLRRSIGILKLNRFHIFEFSRGDDRKYMSEFKVDRDKIYDRCFSIIVQANPAVTDRNSLIVHVSATPEERARRNLIRRSRGEHFVAHKAMEEVYRDDVFCFERDTGSQVSGFLSHDFPIPTISVDNTSPAPDRNFAYVISHIEAMRKHSN